jgi:hypothetical protein
VGHDVAFESAGMVEVEGGLFVPKPSNGAGCQRSGVLTWEPSSVSVHWRPLLAVAIVTHLVTQLWASLSLTTWMQTTGAALLAVKRCSLVWVRSAAQDGRRVCGLLYFAAVPADWHEREHRQGTVDTDQDQVVARVPDFTARWQGTKGGERWLSLVSSW